MIIALTKLNIGMVCVNRNLFNNVKIIVIATDSVALLFLFWMDAITQQWYYMKLLSVIVGVVNEHLIKDSSLYQNQQIHVYCAYESARFSW